MSQHLVLIQADESVWPTRLDTQFPGLEDLCPRKFIVGSEAFDSNTSLHYHIRGFYQAIPQIQGGIHGWTRICFVSYLLAEDIENQEEPDASFWENLDLETDFDRIYGFEGIILPGGKIILGKYSDMQFEGEEDCERGPCIYWEHTSMKNLFDIVSIIDTVECVDYPFLTQFS